MTDRAWLTVYAALAEAIAASQPYDAEGGFMLLHSTCATLGSADTLRSHAASRLHLVAILDAQQRHLDAARHAMIRLGTDLRRRRDLAARGSSGGPFDGPFDGPMPP